MSSQYTVIVIAPDGTMSANGLFRKRERAEHAAELMEDPFSALWLENSDITVIEIEPIED